jgi:hypothetical protein
MLVYSDFIAHFTFHVFDIISIELKQFCFGILTG